MRSPRVAARPSQPDNSAKSRAGRQLRFFATCGWALLVAGFITPYPAAAAGTLNLSRDLVRLGISERNFEPNNPTLDVRPHFTRAIDYAKANAITLVTVDPGHYYFLTPLPGIPDRYTSLFQVTDLTIDFAGSTIFFGTGYFQAFALTDCQRVTLKNFQLDYVRPPYTHVQVTGVDPANRRVTYATLAGWPDPVTLNADQLPPGYGVPEYWGAAFRDNAFVPDTSRMRIVRPIASGVLSFVQDGTPWTQPEALSVLRPGDTMAVASRGGSAPITIFRGDSIVLSGITVFGASGWALNVDQVSNSVIERVQVKPRPGAFLGSNADGIHISSSRRNNVIRDSFVTRTLDDGIAMDSLYVATAITRTGPRQLRVRRELFYRFPNGTTLNFVDPASTQEIAGGVVVSQSPPDSPNPAFGGEVDLLFDRDLPTVPAAAGVVYGSADMRGAGSVIENNHVTEVTGRGIWLSGVRDVAVRRNWIGSTSSAGIVALQQTQTGAGIIAGAGPPVSGILIESNVLYGSIGPMAQETGTQQSIGAIMVASNDNNGFRFARQATNRDVTIRSNFIADSGRAGIWIGELATGTVQDNVIVQWHRRPQMLVWGIGPDDIDFVRDDFDEAIAVRFSTGVTLAGNQIDLTSALPGAVTLTPSFSTAPKGGGDGVLMVDAHVPGLTWSATSDSPWLTLMSGHAGTGNGAIGYSTTANTTTAARTAAVTVAGVTARVQQNRPFLDDPLVPLVTSVRAVHITELRDRIAAVRVRLAMPDLAYEDPALAGGGTVIRARHIADLRTSLAQVYAQLARVLPPFTDVVLAGGMPIKAVHVAELRAAVEAVE